MNTLNSMYGKVELPDQGERLGTGWLPPIPDLRDYTEDQPNIADICTKLKIPQANKPPKSLPASVDLRPWCSPIENQKSIGSCTAHAAVGIVEYFQNRSFGKHLEGSRLFVYKATRNLMGVSGDTGAWLRTAIGALAICGVPPEKYWPYTDKDPEFDNEPPSFVYAIADNYEALKYFCHDPLGKNVPPATVLERVRVHLAAGIPSMFGFFGFPSFDSSDRKGDIPYPCPGEQAEWGHAIMAVGYDDAKKITNLTCNKQTQGALLIRNSWGKEWGDNGYGWLPYEYVLNRLAGDFWSLLDMEWVDTKNFGL